MGFVGNYAPCGLSPQSDDMPVIHKKACILAATGLLFGGAKGEAVELDGFPFNKRVAVLPV